jgi:thiol-disulfide isomerase/thioredoxin
VTVGGVGRVVTGKIEIPAALIGDKKWKCYGSILSVQNYPPSPKPEEILDSIDEKKRDAWMQAFLKTDAGKAYQAEEDKVRSSLHGFTMEFESDGSFRIEDVLPGDYDLTASLFLLSAVPDPDTQGDQIGECHAKISVPAEKNSDHGPSQVPAITMLEARTSRVGKPIQPFSAPTLDGKKLNLSDFKGHYVLLDFWATCCGPCVAEVPNLKAVYDVYGKDGRLKIISLSLDENPANAKRFVEKNQIAWNQVWVGDDAGRQVLDTIEPNNGIPYILLIDPDGKVMATNLRGPGIKSAVAKAMSQK